MAEAPHRDHAEPIASAIAEELAPPPSETHHPIAEHLGKIAPNREERLFLVLSIFIGVISGLLVVCFRVVIEWIKIASLGSAPHAGQYRLLYVPAIAGLIVGAMVQWIFPQARGSGGPCFTAPARIGPTSLPGARARNPSTRSSAFSSRGCIRRWKRRNPKPWLHD